MPNLISAGVHDGAATAVQNLAEAYVSPRASLSTTD
jgi:hypothetical protein